MKNRFRKPKISVLESNVAIFYQYYLLPIFFGKDNLIPSQGFRELEKRKELTHAKLIHSRIVLEKSKQSNCYTDEYNQPDSSRKSLDSSQLQRISVVLREKPIFVKKSLEDTKRLHITEECHYLAAARSTLNRVIMVSTV